MKEDLEDLEGDPATPGTPPKISMSIRSLAAMLAASLSEHLTAPRLMTVTQTARYLGRTERSIESLVRARKLPVNRLGGRVMIDRKVLDGMLDILTEMPDDSPLPHPASSAPH